MCNLLAGTYYLVYDPTSRNTGRRCSLHDSHRWPSQVKISLTSNDTLIGKRRGRHPGRRQRLDQIIPNFDNTINAESVEVRDVIPGVPAVAPSTPAELPVIPPFDQTDLAIVIPDQGSSRPWRRWVFDNRKRSGPV